MKKHFILICISLLLLSGCNIGQKTMIESFAKSIDKEGVIIVYGTQSGSNLSLKMEDRAHQMRRGANEVVKFVLKNQKAKDVNIKKIISDEDITEEELKNNNLIVIGSFKSNKISKEIEDKLAIKLKENRALLSSQEIDLEKDSAIAFVQNNPFNDKYYANFYFEHGEIEPSDLTYYHNGKYDFSIKSGNEKFIVGTIQKKENYKVKVDQNRNSEKYTENRYESKKAILFTDDERLKDNTKMVLKDIDDAIVDIEMMTDTKIDKKQEIYLLANELKRLQILYENNANSKYCLYYNYQSPQKLMLKVKGKALKEIFTKKDVPKSSIIRGALIPVLIEEVPFERMKYTENMKMKDLLNKNFYSMSLEEKNNTGIYLNYLKEEFGEEKLLKLYEKNVEVDLKDAIYQIYDMTMNEIEEEIITR